MFLHFSLGVMLKRTFEMFVLVIMKGMNTTSTSWTFAYTIIFTGIYYVHPSCHSPPTIPKCIIFIKHVLHTFPYTQFFTPQEINKCFTYVGSLQTWEGKKKKKKQSYQSLFFAPSLCFHDLEQKGEHATNFTNTLK